MPNLQIQCETPATLGLTASPVLRSSSQGEQSAVGQKDTAPGSNVTKDPVHITIVFRLHEIQFGSFHVICIIAHGNSRQKDSDHKQSGNFNSCFSPLVGIG